MAGSASTGESPSEIRTVAIDAEVLAGKAFPLSRGHHAGGRH